MRTIFERDSTASDTSTTFIPHLQDQFLKDGKGLTAENAVEVLFRMFKMDTYQLERADFGKTD